MASSKLSQEEQLRRAVGKAARASDRAHMAAWKASMAWREAARLSGELARWCDESAPEVFITNAVSAREKNACEVEAAACWSDRHGSKLARLMGVERG